MPTLAQNKKALHDYEKLVEYEAGLALTGSEVKSVREGNAKLQGSFLILRNGQVWLTGANIPRYSKSPPQTDYDPLRLRPILLHQREIRYLGGKLGQKGLTLVPISLYTRGNRVKLSFWLARGKKTHEKRQKLKERDLDREARRLASDRDR